MSADPLVPYRIQTPRLLLRCWEEADAAILRDSLDRSDAHLRPFIPFMKHEPRSLAETGERLAKIRASFDAREHYQYALLDQSGVLVGEVMLIRRLEDGSLELGYWLDVTQTGRGYATEGSAALVRVAFECHGVDRLELQCEPANVASTRLARRLGFEHTTTRVDGSTDANGKPCDLDVWTLHSDQFPGTVSATQALIGYDARGEQLGLWGQ